MVYPKPTTFVEKIEQKAGNPLFLPGLDPSLRTPYHRIFFGAQKNWPNDEVGWTKIPHSKTVYKMNLETGERRRVDAKITRRDIYRLERKHAGWNLLDM